MWDVERQARDDRAGAVGGVSMKNKVQFIIRNLLAGVMVYFIFRETGPATAIFAALVCVVFELETRFLRELTDILKSFEQ